MSLHLLQGCFSFFSLYSPTIPLLQIEGFGNHVQFCRSYCLREGFFVEFLTLCGAVFYPRGILIIKGLIFVGYIVGKNVHQNLIKGKNMAMNGLFRKIKSQLIRSGVFVIAVTSTLLQFQTRCI